MSVKLNIPTKPEESWWWFLSSRVSFPALFCTCWKTEFTFGIDTVTFPHNLLELLSFYFIYVSAVSPFSYLAFSGVCLSRQSQVSLRLVNFMQLYKVCWIPISSSQRSQTPLIATPIFASQFGVYVCVVSILFTMLVSTLESFGVFYNLLPVLQCTVVMYFKE
jgi:hypothetical protein